MGYNSKTVWASRAYMRVCKLIRFNTIEKSYELADGGWVILTGGAILIICVLNLENHKN